MDLVVADRYRIGERIARGAFGLLFRAVDTQTGKPCAVKLEPLLIKHPQLDYEHRIYKQLAAERSPWLPKIYWFGVSGDYCCLVMELLGPSLQRLHNKGQLSLEYLMHLAPKMIQRLELVQTLVVHRDIKPDNFVLGRGDKADSVYLIDFGLSKTYKRNGEHIPYREDKRFVGTARFASLHTHYGFEQSRRDDLEALAYVLIYLAQGSLPWQGRRGHRRDVNRDIGQLKQDTSVKELCQALPKAFSRFVKYARALEFDEPPDYAWCRALFA